MPFIIDSRNSMEKINDALPGSVYQIRLDGKRQPVYVMTWAAFGACSTATLQGFSISMPYWPEEVWPEFCAFVARLGYSHLDGNYQPKRLFFVTTTKYIDPHRGYMKGCFKKLIESSKLIETFKNHSHNSEPNLMYSLDLNP